MAACQGRIGNGDIDGVYGSQRSVAVGQIVPESAINGCYILDSRSVSGLSEQLPRIQYKDDGGCEYPNDGNDDKEFNEGKRVGT